MPDPAPTPPLSRRRKLAFALVANLVAGALVVAACEGWGALYVDLPGAFFARHARLNHTWPQSKARVQRHYADLTGGRVQPWTQTFNAQCWLEDYDVAPRPEPGTYRVFYVGDSFVEGAVPMNESLPSRVERSLNADLNPAGHRVEVINTGTPSYSPSLHYVLVRYVLSGYAPDLIVVCVDMTDDYDDWKYDLTAVFDDQGKLWGVPPRQIYDAVFMDTARGTIRKTWGTDLHLFLFQNSYFYNYLRLKFFPLPADAPSAPADAQVASDVYQRWAWCREPWSEETERNAARTLGYVRDLARYCSAQGIALMITGVPHHEQFAGPDGAPPAWSSRPHRELAKVAAEEGVAYLDGQAALSPQLSGSAHADYYHPGDMHFNGRGNALWADAHLRALRDPAWSLFPAEWYAALGK